jgi:methyl-accepting chemotaxis protein
MAKRPYRRRQFLVDPKLQLGLNLMVMVLLATYFALFCVATVCVPYLLADSDDVPDYWLGDVVAELVQVLDLVGLPLGLTFLFLVLHCVVLTHRIAGPAYRFRKTCESVRARDLGVEIHLRKKDYMGDLASEFNGMLETLREDLGEVTREVDAIAESARAMAEDLGESEDTRLADLVDRSGRAAELLGRYRLRSGAEET